MYCKAPERAALIGIVEQSLVVDACNCADNFARRIILRHKIGDGAIVALARKEVGAQLHHTAGGVDSIDAVRVYFGYRTANADAACAAATGAIVGKFKTKCVRRIKEDFCGACESSTCGSLT